MFHLNGCDLMDMNVNRHGGHRGTRQTVDLYIRIKGHRMEFQRRKTQLLYFFTSILFSHGKLNLSIERDFILLFLLNSFFCSQSKKSYTRGATKDFFSPSVHQAIDPIRSTNLSNRRPETRLSDNPRLIN